MPHISKVTIEVSVNNGEKVTLVMNDPPPMGDNPRFLTTQAESALRDATRRIHHILEAAYGTQANPSA